MLHRHEVGSGRDMAVKIYVEHGSTDSETKVSYITTANALLYPSIKCFMRDRQEDRSEAPMSAVVFLFVQACRLGGPGRH